MSTKIVGAAKKQVAEKVLSKKPILVLFFMTGCPHCLANEKAWKEAKKKVGGNTQIAEIEASATPDSAGVSGFPTMKYIDETGQERETSGAKQSGDEILNELQVPKKSSGGRRHTRGRSRNIRKRKLRYRSLRNNVALA